MEADITLAFARQKNLLIYRRMHQVYPSVSCANTLASCCGIKSCEFRLIPVTVHLLKTREVLVLLMLCLSLSAFCSLHVPVDFCLKQSFPFGTEFFKSVWNGEGNGSTKEAGCWGGDYAGAVACTRLHPRKALQIEIRVKKQQKHIEF